MISQKIRRLIEVVNALSIGIITQESFDEWYFMYHNPCGMGRGALYEVCRKSNKYVGGKYNGERVIA